MIQNPKDVTPEVNQYTVVKRSVQDYKIRILYSCIFVEECLGVPRVQLPVQPAVCGKWILACSTYAGALVWLVW